MVPVMKTKGFSLPELIVSVAIVTIIAGVIVVNQSSFNRRVTLTNLSHELAFVFREAQLNAVNVRPTESSYDVGYGVRVDYTEGNLFTFANRDGVMTYNQNNDTLLNTIDLPSGFEIQSLCYEGGTTEGCLLANRIDIVFTRPSLAASIAAHDGSSWRGATRAVVTIANTVTEEHRRIIIESSGQIYTNVE